MHYEIGNLPWDFLKFFLGMWFGACCVYGNRHVTTKSIHEGMLRTLRSQRERINELMGVPTRCEEFDTVEEEVEVEEVELEEARPSYRKATIVPVPQSKKPIPPKPVRVYQEFPAITATKKQTRNLEKAPTQIRRLTRVDEEPGADKK